MPDDGRGSQADERLKPNAEDTTGPGAADAQDPSGHGSTSEPSDSGGCRSDPYRWACPRGHVFQRAFDPQGTVECYTCKRTYDAADLVDRRTERAVPPWGPDR